MAEALELELAVARAAREPLELLARIVTRTPQQRAVASEAASVLRGLGGAPANAR